MKEASIKPSDKYSFFSTRRYCTAVNGLYAIAILSVRPSLQVIIIVIIVIISL